MLNSKGERELCYVVRVDDIMPIEGAENVELAAVGGWRIMVRKNQFHPGDPAIYFEIDSKVPETEVFAFLAPKHYKIKTQKYFKGTVISQGLLMHAEDFGWEIYTEPISTGIEQEFQSTTCIKDDEGIKHFVDRESRFLTQKLGVTYAEAGDNTRKAAAADKYKLMAGRHGKLFSHQPYCWLMKREWGKKLLFLFYGKKRDKKTSWPSWVAKTDEERIQNMPWILKDDGKWIATEKIDGTSTTFTMKRKGRKKIFLVCSRNVVFDKPDKKCFYETNVYTEMAEKYNIEQILSAMLDKFPEAEWITIQGETYGAGIQKRDYSISDHQFMAFNLIMSHLGRLGTIDMRNELQFIWGIPCVPIVESNIYLPETVEETLECAEGNSLVDGKPREGIVFRSMDGSKSFKAVSNSYLMKYHG